MNQDNLKKYYLDAKLLCLEDDVSLKRAMEVIDKGEDRICFLINDKNKLIRIISDGDVRRAILNDYSLNDLAVKIHDRNPVVAFADQALEQVEVLFNKRINIIPVLNNKGVIIGVLRHQDILPFVDIKSKEIAVVGLGYVGLTLALTLADRGFSVKGFDLNKDLISDLNNKIAPFYEDGLENYLNNHIGHNLRPISAKTELTADVYIITVGTPIDKNILKPNTKAIVSASKSVGKKLKINDLVIMRSTLPIGCTRKIVIPILEKESGLKAGEEFFVSMCPERTAEGRALEELKTLPQIIGGINKKSRELSMRLFNENTHTVIDIGSLEAAEMCKLMDNSYRDVRFAFSNQIAMLSEKLGLNLNELIKKVNLAYERNSIPYPSPGVGGACLSKDPYILYNNLMEEGIDGGLLLKAREINERIPKDIYFRSEKILNEVGKSLISSKVFIVGFAFKGQPETSDLRESTTLWFLDKLKEEGVNNIYGFDPIIKKDEIQSLGVNHCSLEEGFKNADAVFFMNNHRSYKKLNISKLINLMREPALFCDSWQMFEVSHIKSHSNIIYTGVGI